MRTFIRILKYAPPMSSFLLTYGVFTVFYVVFNLINFSALIPILEVLFDQNEIATSEAPGTVGIGSLKDWYHYYFDNLILKEGKSSALGAICVIVLVSVFLANLFRYLADITLVKLRVSIISKMRARLFENIIELPLSFFSERKKGDLVARFTTDIQEIEVSIIYSLKVFLKEPLVIIGFLFILFSISAELTLYSLILLPVSGIAISGIAKKLKGNATKSQAILGEINAVISESIWGIRIIKAFGANSFAKKQMKAQIQKYAHVDSIIGKRFQLAGPMSEFLGVFTVVVILLIGGKMVLSNQGSLSTPEFLAFLIIFSQVLPPAKSISQAYTLMQKGLASADRIFELQDTNFKILEAATPIRIKTFTKSIRFEKVCFGYSSTPILKRINLEIKKGKRYALVGLSGSGKSTLADLIARFHDPTEGNIFIDNLNLKNCCLDDLRKLIGFVNQEPILFNDTVFNNIALGDANANLEKVTAAAAIANASEFIEQLAEGYHANIGERGNKLSGGQKQRIAIARAVYNNPPILILDEATTSLDANSEKLVHEALSNLMAGRTTLIISHNLELVDEVDYLYQLENGELKKTGIHELLDDGSLKLSSGF